MQTNTNAEIKDNVKARMEAPKSVDNPLLMKGHEGKDFKAVAEEPYDALKSEKEYLLQEIKNNIRLRCDAESEVKKLQLEMDKLKKVKEKDHNCQVKVLNLIKL